MTILLYFVAFGSLAVLVASFAVGAIWLTIKFFQAWGRFFRAMLEPPDPARIRPSARVDLNSLKRAGQ